MKFGKLWGASGVALASVCGGGAADAQLLSLNINVSHTAQSAGAPRQIVSDGGGRSLLAGPNVRFPVGPGTIFSTITPSPIDNRNLVAFTGANITPGSLSPAVQATLIPAQ